MALPKEITEDLERVEKFHEKEAKKEKYDHYVTCWNCGYENNFKIPKGEQVETFLDENKCIKCECHCRMK